jgi:DUF1365 family protein
MTMSAIYPGSVVHTRLRPVRHRLRYRMLCVLLDLDELPDLARRLRLFSFNRFNLFDFRERDHLAGRREALRPQVETCLRRAGIDAGGGPIRLLCMPRVLGAVFNPLSVYFCHYRDGALAAAVYEVNNTFGERHSYVIPANAAGQPNLRQSCTKHFYVSPFMDMAMTYHFRLALPAQRVAVAIEVRDAAGPVLSAAFAGRRIELTDANLLRAFVRSPLQAAKVLGGIHWEALKLWRKGLAVRPRPPAPDDPISLASSAEAP